MRATAIVLLGLVGSLALDTWSADSPSRYVPMVAAVVVAARSSRSRSVIAAIVVVWTIAWFALAAPAWSLTVTDQDEVLGWLLSLALSLAVVSTASTLRSERVLAESRAIRAERARVRAGELQRLTGELSRALTPSDVARALVETMPEIVGAEGAALGLTDGSALEIVDPLGAVSQTLRPGLRLPLTAAAPITTAARTGRVAAAADRASFERDFPHGARLAPYASAAVAVPLMVGGRVVGSVGLPFAGPLEPDTVFLAELAAALGSQALERAERFSREQSTRAMLDRIGRLGPLLAEQPADDIARSIAREAQQLLTCDRVRVLERAAGDRLELVASAPESPDETVTANEPEDGATQALERAEPVITSHESAAGGGPATTTLCLPVAAAGRPRYVLELVRRTVGEGGMVETIALAQRIADQAGVAFESAARRSAQEEATARASETRRLFDVTTALAATLEPGDVGRAMLDEGVRSFGADRGTVVARVDGALTVVASTDRHDRPGDQLSPERALASVVSRGEARVEDCWLGLPLVAAGDVVGGVELAFREPRAFDEHDRRFGIAFARQAGQALARALLFVGEQAARQRAERMARELAQLHAVGTSLAGAASVGEVALTVTEHVVSAVDAAVAAVYVVEPDESLALAGRATGAGELERAVRLERAVSAGATIRSALARPTATWLEDPEELAVAAAELGWGDAGVTHAAVLPLTAHDSRSGVLVVLFLGASSPDAQARSMVETLARQAAQPLGRVLALERERSTRRRAELASERLGRLQRLTGSLSRALSPDEVLAVVVREVPTTLEAQCLAVYTADPEEWHRVGETDDPLLGLLGGEEGRKGCELVEHVLATGEIALRECTLDDSETPEGAPETHSVCALVPLGAGGGRTLGVAVLCWPDRSALTAGQRSFVETVASQCGQALDRASRYEAERRVAEALQRSVLPQMLTSLEGAAVAARYLPGSAAVDVGGDWFDTIPLPDGRIAFVVGDVVGKGVHAASTMAQMRNGMRALALDCSDAVRIVGQLNRLLEGSSESPFATMALMAVDPATHVAEIVSAGHLPPIVVAPDGRSTTLDGEGGLPLGVDPDAVYTSWQVPLAPGSYVLLYTDGLVERRGRSLDDGLQHLLDAAAGAPKSPDLLAEAVLDELIGDDTRRDDVALLVIGLDAEPLGTLRLRLPASSASLVTLRRELTDWLGRANVAAGDRHDIVLAAWEAGANAVEHAVDPSQPWIVVEARLIGDGVTVTVRDTGSWRTQEARRGRGLGLSLIRSLMTRVEVQPSAEGGKVVVMERSLARRRPEERVGGASSG
ncbi:MAG: SpoIIE family protein phosphatase [Gaiella sp.]